MRIKALALAVPAATFALAFPSIGSATSFTVLHSFSGPEGETPAAALVQGADGFFYGVAAHGGDFTVLPPDGGGTAFRVDASGNVTTLHTFKGPEGAWPKSLIQGRDGFFYGTATLGGQPSISPLNPGVGTIFRMDAAGVVTVLYVFPYSIGGGSSQPGPIVQGADGALYGSALGAYGTSAVGGYIYRFDPITGVFRHLHDFVGSDGAIPTGPLFQAIDGFFYGTTNQGGLWNSGVIYKVDVVGHFVLLHSLSPLYPGEGSEPKGGVIQASDGFFYGTTEHGGYYGEVFRMDAAGNFTVLHRFDAYASDGGSPVSGLIEGRDGFLYGTASIGGQPVTASRYGVVYRMDKAGTVTVLHTFTGPDGRTPWAALVQSADGRLYGSTVVGGALGLGVLFRVDSGSIDLTAPNTSISSHPANPTNQTSASFAFTATETATFECKLDGGAFTACTSAKAYAGLAASSHTFQVRAKDTAGNTDATPASFTWLIDTTPPTAPNAPEKTLAPNGTLPLSASGQIPVSIYWTAATDPSSGIAKYELWQSVNGGASTLTATTSSLGVVRQLTPGAQYQFTVRAFDRAGNAGPLAAGTAFRPGTWQESSPQLTYSTSPAWTTLTDATKYYGGGEKQATTLNAQATLAVPAGTQQIGWASATGPNYAIATIYLDGTIIKTADLYAPTAQRRKIVATFTTTPGTTHTVRIKTTAKNPASTGYLDTVDAFLFIH